MFLFYYFLITSPKRSLGVQYIPVTITGC